MMKKLTPRILVTNDDGFFSDSLEGLMEALRPLGEVTAIVPEQERSGVSQSITLHKPLRCRQVRLGGAELYVTNGTPTDCVLLGRWELLKDRLPDLVVSGVNRGPNLGEDALYSGTVAAAREGALLGLPAFAVSIADFEDPQHYEPAYAIAKALAERILAIAHFPDRMFLNVNVPNLPASKIKGVKITQLGRRRYVDIIDKRKDPRGKVYYWIDGSRVESDTTPGTDSHAVANGSISISPVRLDFRAGPESAVFRTWDTALEFQGGGKKK